MSQELEAGSFELHIHDAHYPHALMDLERPPEVLYGIGDYSVLEKPQLAIIGARRASPYGLALARIAGRIAAECGLVLLRSKNPKRLRNFSFSLANSATALCISAA